MSRPHLFDGPLHEQTCVYCGRDRTALSEEEYCPTSRFERAALNRVLFGQSDQEEQEFGR